MSHSSLPVALLASHPPCGSLWAAPKATLGPRFPSGQFAALTRREKALYCPFLQEGVRNVAHSILDSFYLLSCALVLTLILFQKRQGFFPSLPIAALLPRRWLWLGSNSGAWDVTMQLVLQRRKKTPHFLNSWRQMCPISTSWNASACLEYFSNKKASAGSNPRWPFSKP